MNLRHQLPFVSDRELPNELHFEDGHPLPDILGLDGVSIGDHVTLDGSRGTGTIRITSFSTSHPLFNGPSVVVRGRLVDDAFNRPADSKVRVLALAGVATTDSATMNGAYPTFDDDVTLQA